MSQQDKEHFASFAHAQVAITNQLYDYLNKPNIFIFCPTGFLFFIYFKSIKDCFSFRIL
jgi:hypothetical protein